LISISRLAVLRQYSSYRSNICSCTDKLPPVTNNAHHFVSPRMIELLSNPNAWIGLLTLVVLEIVLGIDNLIFIAIQVEKLPPEQRDRARIIGLTLALFMRLGLLSVIAWIVSLTDPLFGIGGLNFSARDLILLFGGTFLLYKATTELHERLEGISHTATTSKVYASFAVVVAQIVVLDAVFSLDAVLTAVGMVDDLPVMITAVVISMSIMLFASKPLTRFVNAHPTVVVLCLSFLLMIGLALVAEGLGFDLPKGYLYAAIGFSILIEFFNQWSRRSVVAHEARRPLRDRTAESVWKLMGGRHSANSVNANTPENEPLETPAFGSQERNMMSGVLTLAERSVRSIMTPRSDISWVDLDDHPAAIKGQVLETPHNSFLVCRGELDRVLGVARGKDLMGDLALLGKIDEAVSLRRPIVLPESAAILMVIETLKKSRGQLILIADEFGTLQGLITPIDILEAIAGEFPDEDEQLSVRLLGPGHWIADGTADLQLLEQFLETEDLFQKDRDYQSLAGFLLSRFTTLPKAGQTTEAGGFKFEVAEVTANRITAVKIQSVAAIAAVIP
jgi:CBS domain containing-hemolysin-like protein